MYRTDADNRRPSGLSALMPSLRLHLYERLFLLAVTGLVVLLGLAFLFGLRVNLSRSHPGVLFWTSPAGEIAVNDLVAFCLPFAISTYPAMQQSTRRICAQDQRGALVLKRVAEIQPDGKLWVVGSGPGSLDSMVFGAIPVDAVRYGAEQVW